ncbi:dolichyl-P-Man:Man5GlcNAc2-PP-dolichol alpha-1,3-mannosyltransferase [Malassezia vespertilionis]|uniref:Gaa1p n=1 Tax=Malassezia vespertilionis TaxID=2020962 RepID=A0A2N1J873_9BASI|nr:dolichyl-P-Man:Man5GlcNAc2-PP-dolichol alpha-1,3-mannosyltransferase [Malassezia vespertilionis]PKI82755.1 Gaa1p [Malassezia vespertilionis]WFD08213.1 dolichyl-P-Man:Man5GlcNAc2-PP-dolichol alpha-1,3-mannosyltransferase [Malassezia vespertilionis]
MSAAVPTVAPPAQQVPDASAALVDPRLVRSLTIKRRIVQSMADMLRAYCAVLLLAALVLLAGLAVPASPFSRGIYVDENALHPGQTTAAWDWDQVKYADTVSEQLLAYAQQENDGARIDYMCAELASFGLAPHTQNYTFHVPGRAIHGRNVYARSYTPRIDGREAMVLAAPWHSRWKARPGNATLPYTPHGAQRALNIRGVAAALALAKHLTSIPYWSKDLIVILSDGHLDGMQAWASSYFGAPTPALCADDVQDGGAQIWNALALDFPGEHYRLCSLLHEGRDGLLPNLDTLNTVVATMDSAYMGDDVRLHGAPDKSSWSLDTLVSFGIPRGPLAKLERRLLGRDGLQTYLTHWKALLAQWRLQLAGHPSGVHGVLLPFHIDGVTLFGEPADGPLGFWEMGRISEGTLRAFSNLIERLHHSQFFYLLQSPWRFVQIGTYLFIPLLVSAALTLTGLALWNALGTRRDVHRAMLVARLAPNTHSVRLERPTWTETMQSAKHLAPPVQAEFSAAFLALARPVWPAMLCVAVCALGGVASMVIAVHAPLHCAANGVRHCPSVWALSAVAMAVPLLVSVGAYAMRVRMMPLATCLHAFGLLHTGMVASVLAPLNFAQASSMALVIAVVAYSLVPPWGTRCDRPVRTGACASVHYAIHFAMMAAAVPSVLLLLAELGASLGAAPYALDQLRSVVEGAIVDHHVLRTSTFMFVFLGYLPALLELATACCMYWLTVME